jgi:hypothetical protein
MHSCLVSAFGIGGLFWSKSRSNDGFLSGKMDVSERLIYWNGSELSPQEIVEKVLIMEPVVTPAPGDEKASEPRMSPRWKEFFLYEADDTRLLTSCDGSMLK